MDFWEFSWDLLCLLLRMFASSLAAPLSVISLYYVRKRENKIHTNGHKTPEIAARYLHPNKWSQDAWNCCMLVNYLHPHKWSQDAWNCCMLVNYLHPHKWSQDAWNRPETDQRSKRDLLTRVQNKTCYTSKRDLYKQKWPTKRAKETYQHGFKTKHAFWGSGLGSPVSGATLLFYRSIFRSHFFFKKKTCILGQRAWQPTS